MLLCSRVFVRSVTSSGAVGRQVCTVTIHATVCSICETETSGNCRNCCRLVVAIVVVAVVVVVVAISLPRSDHVIGDRKCMKKRNTVDRRSILNIKLIEDQ